MKNDEEQIRGLVTNWMQATKAGDVETLLGLMTDDVVFLLPGQPPMDKQTFAAAAKVQSTGNAPAFEGTSEIQEVRILGDWAYLWTRLTVEATFPDGRPAMKRAGHTLSILRKESGKWRLARDANMLTSVEPQGARQP